jgi:hypothetical protein
MRSITFALIIAAACTEDTRERPPLETVDAGAEGEGEDDGGGGRKDGAPEPASDLGSDAAAAAPAGAACDETTTCAGDGGRCETNWPEGYCTSPCTTSSDCPGGSAEALCLGDPGEETCLDLCDPGGDPCRPGYLCFDLGRIAVILSGTRVCLPFQCESEADCDEGQLCGDNFNCYTPGAEVGDPCADPGDCPAAGFCAGEPDFGLPGGYCILGCDDAPCPDGAVCIDTDDGSHVCVDGCATDGCRPGYACVRDTGEPWCFARCRDDGDCTGGRHCTVTGGCGPAFDPADLGDPCSGDEGCTGGGCLTEDLGFPGGLCRGGPCDPAGGEPACPGDGVCLEEGDGPLGACWDGCADDGDCRDGYACLNFAGAGVCFPPIAAEDIGEPCDDAADCGGGACAGALPGGYCFGLCSDEEECPDGSLCFLGADDPIGLCAGRCDGGEGACRDGYTCEPPGVCQAILPPEMIGGPCEAALADCPGGVCLDEESTGYPRGLCTDSCTDGACPEGRACVGEVCLATCDAGCRAGTACDAESDTCVPACADSGECASRCCVDGRCVDAGSCPD